MRGETSVNCEDVRVRLVDYQRGRLPAATHADVRRHLEGCADCTQAEAVEQELTWVLERRLPQHPASLALKRRLAAQWLPSSPLPPWWARWRPAFAPAVAVALVLVVGAPLLYHERTVSRERNAQAGMVAEAVNDHLRLLTSLHPLDIESGGIHQVKPWFEGRLDFAPIVPFEGDADFPLKGGAVGYFLDRKAAVLVYARRLHPISLLIFRAEGLAWPARGLTPMDGVDAYVSAERGFNVVMWRRGGLGYALVSDVDAAELKSLATKLAGRS